MDHAAVKMGHFLVGHAQIMVDNGQLSISSHWYKETKEVQ
jgi:hypothetical protein